MLVSFGKRERQKARRPSGRRCALYLLRSAVMAALGVASLSAAPPPALDTPLVLTQVPVRATVPAARVSPEARLRDESFNGARLVLLAPDGSTEVLVPGFAAACDPDVSYDGQRLLFAGKRVATDRWAVWELGLEDRQLRRVTQDERDCRSPIYLSSLFTLDSPEPWFTVLFTRVEALWDERGTGRVTRLCTVKLDGTEFRELTHAPAAHLDPAQLPDGRVVYSAWREPLNEPGDAGRLSLFAVHMDGIDHELYGGNAGPRFQQMSCVTGDGRVVLVEADSLGVDGAGQLAIIRQQRPLHNYARLTREPGVEWLYPSPLEPGTLLVARRKAQAGGNWGLVRFAIDSGHSDVLYDTPEYHEIQAKAVRARPVPDGRSTVVDMQFKTGKLYGLDCTIADPRMQPHLEPGLIRRLRVAEGVPAAVDRAAPDRSAGNTTVLRRLLGDVPVEADGSFHVRIPANIPVQLQALDENGLALATCGWIWVKPRENRGCIGCHEDPELVPENRFVQALARKANDLTLPPERRRTVTFRGEILPILQTHCATADCHGGSESSLWMGVSGGQSVDSAAEELYARLLTRDPNRESPAVHPGEARTSPLIWHVLGRRTDRPWDRSWDSEKVTDVIPRMPPPDGAPLSDRQIRLLVEWIDLGTPWAVSREADAAAGPTGEAGEMDEDETR